MASEDKAASNRPFDTKMVEFLVKLMADKDLSEIDLHEGEHRIRLRRGARVVAAAPVAAAPAPVSHPAPPPPAAVPVATPVAAPAKAKLHEIKSPMIGTFYSKPKPDKDDYVKVGAKVKPETVVCQVEAMKLFNEIAAECTGTIAEVCVKNGQAVEFDTVLFRVELG